jgi:hypothetical protein
VKLECGRRYLLRNRAIVVLKEMRKAVCGQCAVRYWVGAVVATGEPMTWREDGRYPAVDAAPHQWDITKPARKR